MKNYIIGFLLGFVVTSAIVGYELMEGGLFIKDVNLKEGEASC